MVLNTGGSFPEFFSNFTIVDNAIRTHKETKKRKVVAAPSESAPLKYRMVYQTVKSRRERLWQLCPKVLPRST
jgi:hypothetical protein